MPIYRLAFFLICQALFLKFNILIIIHLILLQPFGIYKKINLNKNHAKFMNFVEFIFRKLKHILKEDKKFGPFFNEKGLK